MDDDMSPEDAYALGLTIIAKEMPKPKPSMALSQSSLARLDTHGLDILAKYYREHGVGPVAKGRFMICEPDLFDPVFRGLGLVESDDTPFAATYSAFGAVSAITRAGHEIMVDPVTEAAWVYFGAKEDSLFFQVTLATTISSAVSSASEPDQLIDLQGRDLFKSVAGRLGPLAHRSCYGFTRRGDDPERFRADTFRVVDVVDYILSANDASPFNIEKVELPDTPAGPAWGDDWDD